MFNTRCVSIIPLMAGRQSAKHISKVWKRRKLPQSEGKFFFIMDSFMFYPKTFIFLCIRCVNPPSVCRRTRRCKRIRDAPKHVSCVVSPAAPSSSRLPDHIHCSWITSRPHPSGSAQHFKSLYSKWNKLFLAAAGGCEFKLFVSRTAAEKMAPGPEEPKRFNDREQSCFSRVLVNLLSLNEVTLRRPAHLQTWTDSHRSNKSSVCNFIFTFMYSLWRLSIISNLKS